MWIQNEEDLNKNASELHAYTGEEYNYIGALAKTSVKKKAFNY